MKIHRKNFIIILSLSIVLISGIIISSGIFSESYSELEEEVILESEMLLPEINIEYGLSSDSFNITRGKVLRNQNLSDILTRYGISYQQIDKLVKISDPVFNVRKIKSGNPYCVYCDSDSNKVQYFIYEENPASYIKYIFGDSICVIREEKEIRHEKKYSSGVIESSLWNSMAGNNINPLLAIELSEIYAWSIDFFGIQKGDSFRVIYDEDFVDTISMGISKVHSACFTHYGNDYWAFEYVQDGISSFFDEKGNSLRKAFLKAPLKYSRISSKFSNSRFHPVLKIRRPHHGVDYSAPTGTPVHTIGDGVIIDKGYQKSGGGRFVKIKHNSVYTTTYMHFSNFAEGINTGVRVHQGQVIGYVGSSGLATGPHLDFRVYQNGTAIDPLKLKSPPVEPVKKENMGEYLEYVRAVKSEYNSQSLSEKYLFLQQL